MLSCKEIRLKVKEDLNNKLNSIDTKLNLTVFQVGNNPASDIYVKNKKNLCEEMGISFTLLKYDEITEEELISKIDACNKDDKVTGILVQLPLPSYIDEKKVLESINPLKDVDGLTSVNMGKLSNGEKCLVPCTALGIMKIFEYNDIDLLGKDLVIVGRSKLVGLPLISLFLKRNSTVTVCHSKTLNLKEKTSNADILVVAIGNKEFVKEDFVKDGSIVIDVGINRENNKLYGDCDFNNIKDKAEYITPVPGGVGVLTTIMLVNNVYEAYLLQKSSIN